MKPYVYLLAGLAVVTGCTAPSAGATGGGQGGVSPPAVDAVDAGTPSPVPDAGTPAPDGGLTVIEPKKPEPKWPEVQTSLPEYELVIPRVQELCANVKNREYIVPGTFKAGGESYAVQVRFRGRHTRFLAKRPFQVKFPRGVSFDGRRQLELLASWKDGGHLTEKMWYDLAAAFGVPASNAQYVVLTYDDCDGTKKRGVYTDLEAVKKPFLEAHGFDDDSDIYRCGMHDCELRDTRARESWMEPWEKRTNDSQSWDNLWTFLSTVSRTAPNGFAEKLEQVMDVDALLAWMAVDAAISNDVVQDSRSFLIQDADTRQWFYVPWDLNNAVSIYNRKDDNYRQSVEGKASRPIFGFTLYDWNALNGPDYLDRLSMYSDMKPAWNVLFTRVLDDEKLRMRFHATLKKLLETRFHPDEICPRAEKQAKLLRQVQLEEAKQTACQLSHGTGSCEAIKTLVNPDFIAPVSSTDSTPRSADFMCRFVKARRKFLLSKLDEIERHGKTALRISAVGVRGDGTRVVEIVNSSSSPLSTGGYKLTGDLRRMTQSTLPNRTLAPGEVLVLTTRPTGSEGTLNATLDLTRPEVGLFTSDASAAVDAVYLPRLEEGTVYRRASPSSESWEKKDR